MPFDKQGFYREIGYLLQTHRKRRGMTQEEIAAALGVPRPTYANAEAGRQRITVDFLWKAAVVLGMPLQKLVPEPLASLPLWAEPADPATGEPPTSFGYILPHESAKRTSGTGAA